jgi:hypothetical protein
METDNGYEWDVSFDPINGEQVMLDVGDEVCYLTVADLESMLQALS